jgi:NAD-dependent dihydropyrimidine dehydrogenase PreA subunit
MPTPSTESCRAEPGRVAPVVDRNRCEAKADCIVACPYDVFELRPLAAQDRAALSWFGKLRARVHGNRQAYVIRPEACHACQLCVEACPEQALRLAPLGT